MKNPEGVRAFGVRLRQIREGYSWSQQRLADEADVAKTTIQKIELGKLCATIDVLISLSKALELPLSELVKFDAAEEREK